MSTVVSLCDLTGNFAQPWVNAGFDAILVDPQHGKDSTTYTPHGGATIKLACTVDEALPFLSTFLGDIAFVAGFPPCTDLSASGARWWKDKRAKDYMFQAKATAVAEQCRTFARLTGAPYFIENPKGALARVFGPGIHMEPYWYTGYEPADNYTKETYLWTGGGFVMPPPLRDTTLGDPDDRIHKAGPGPERANFRSATPMGFARAVFDSNVTMAVERVA